MKSYVRVNEPLSITAKCEQNHVSSSRTFTPKAVASNVLLLSKLASGAVFC
jgi:hypothetical protein